VSGSRVGPRWRPYPAYRDSGVEWLGEVPEGWEVRRLKTVAVAKPSNVDKKSEEGQRPIRLCNYVDVYKNESITADLPFMAATATDAQIRDFRIKPSDVLATKDSETADDIAVPALVQVDEPDLLCGYHLTMIRPGSDLLGAYLFRCMQAEGMSNQFMLSANGVTRFGLPVSAFTEALLLLPPLPEQQAIAAFLDRETIKIDTLIAKKERLLEFLDEKRTALISWAVTKGLDPGAPMKDSGVEWLGEVPEGWEVTSLSRVTQSRCDGPFGSGLKTEHYEDSGIRVIRLQNVGFAGFRDSDRAFISEQYYKTSLGDHSVNEGDLLIAGLGDSEHPVGRACVAPAGISPAMVKADCFRFRLDSRRVFSPFVALQLSITAAAAGGAEATGATRARMNLSSTSARRIATPPLSEQQAIAAYLDRETTKLDTLKSKIQKAIDLLKEYRTALISAAVTGKIDVRDEVAT